MRYMVLVVAFTRVMLNVAGLRGFCLPRSSLTHVMFALTLVEQTRVLPGKPGGGKYTVPLGDWMKRISPETK